MYENNKLFALALLLLTVHTLRGEVPARLQGLWCTTEVLSTSNIAALSREQAKTFVSTKIRVTPTSFRSGDQAVEAPRFRVARFRSDEMVDRFMILPKEIGLTASIVTEVDVLTSNGRLAGLPGDTIFLKSAGRIVWYWKGVFFAARRCDGAK